MRITMSPNFKIGAREIGIGKPSYIIAELSANHNKSLQIALDSIAAAKEAGADAVKLQTYTPDTLTINCDNEHFRIKGGTLWDGKTLYDLYGEAYMPWEWHAQLIQKAQEINIDIFSTPYDKTALDFLENLNMPVYKIASFEMVDIPLIKLIASKQKPIIMSTGMSTMAEIEEAVEAIRSQGNNQIALLKCTSAYPAPIHEMNLLGIKELRERFNVVVGLSDHTLGSEIASLSIALGGCIIEKHFTLARKNGGADSSFSLEPNELKEMIEKVRNAEKALGKITFGENEKEKNSKIFRRSLFVVQDVKKGEAFSADNIRSIRPGAGLAPKHYDALIGKKASQDIVRGTPLSLNLIDGGI